MKKRCYVLILLMLTIPGFLFAQMPLVSDNAFILGKDELQMELSNSSRIEKCPLSTYRNNLTAIVFTYGLFDKTDLVFSSEYLFGNATILSENSEYKGILDLNIDFKQLLYESKKFSSSLKAGISIPTGNHEIGCGSGKVGFKFQSISTLVLAKLALNFNAGYFRNENVLCEPKNITSFSTSFDINLFKDLHLVFDTGFDRCIATEEAQLFRFNLIGAYYVFKNCELSLGYLGDTCHETFGKSISAGFTHVF